MIIIMIIIIRDGYHLNSLPWAQLYLSVPNRFFSIPMVSNHVMFVVRVYMGVGLFWGCSVDGRWVVVRLAVQNTYVQHFNCNYGCVCLFQCMRECACVISVMHDQLNFQCYKGLFRNMHIGMSDQDIGHVVQQILLPVFCLWGFCFIFGFSYRHRRIHAHTQKTFSDNKCIFMLTHKSFFFGFC